MAASTLSRLRGRLADPSLLRDKGCIGGEWVGALSGATYDVLDPATGESVAKLPRRRLDRMQWRSGSM